MPKTLEEKRKYWREYAVKWRSIPENKEKKKKTDKKYRTNNYAKCKASWDKWRKENNEHVKLRTRNNYAKNKEERSKYRREYFKKHEEELLKYWKERRQRPEVKARDNASKKISRKKRYARDPSAKLASLIRGRIQKALVGFYKSSSSIELLGCSIEECRKYLESKFLEGMSWKNCSYYGWHIDHIIPCASFDFSKPEEQAKCFHYTNLQPLWAIDNLKKGDK